MLYTIARHQLFICHQVHVWMASQKTYIPKNMNLHMYYITQLNHNGSCRNKITCNFANMTMFMSSCTLFWDVILGWYHEILGWKFIIIYFFKWQTEKKPDLEQYEVCLLKYIRIITNFRPKLTSEHIVLQTTWKGFWLSDTFFFFFLAKLLSYSLNCRCSTDFKQFVHAHSSVYFFESLHTFELLLSLVWIDH